jgi:hypothetical protein
MTIKQMCELALKDFHGSGIELAALLAFIAVESGGKGFATDTGKIMIQIEPAWFKKRAPFAPSGDWSLNKVERQTAEWKAFNSAFSINPNAAMESTSIGLPQIMGFHWRRLGYTSVGAMWDDFKVGELRQIKALIKFILTDDKLKTALVNKDWHRVAAIYNGAGYKALAEKYGREPYDESMRKAYLKYSAE